MSGGRGGVVVGGEDGAPGRVIGEGGITRRRLLIGERYNAWCRGRADRLASRRKRPESTGNAREWYTAGWHYTQRQLERGEILQLALPLEGGEIVA